MTDLIPVALNLLRRKDTFTQLADVNPDRLFDDKASRAIYFACKNIYDADPTKTEIILAEVYTMLDSMYFGRLNKVDERDLAKTVTKGVWEKHDALVDESVIEEALRRIRHTQTAQDLIGDLVRTVNQNADIDVMKVLRQMEGLNGKDDLRIAYQNIERAPENIERFPVYVPRIDDALAGGLTRGDFGVVIASPGFGKTRTLVHIAARNFAVARRHCAFITLELSGQAVGERFDLHFRRAESGATWKHISGLFERGDASLDIYDFSAESCTVGKIRSLLTREAARGKQYDLICIDHLNLMSPSKNYGDNSSSQMYQMYGDIARDLRKLALQFNVVVWTSAISSREGHRKMLEGGIIDTQDIGESFQIGYVSDVIVSLNQTLQEREQNVARIHLAKNRKSHHHPAPVRVIVNDRRMTYET